MAGSAPRKHNRLHGVHDIFICHSSTDGPVASAICERLEAAGLRAWIAPRDPQPGLAYAGQIVAAIERCKVLLLVMSAGANASPHVLSEVELAKNRGRTILPVRIENVQPAPDLEFFIRSVHWYDAVGASPNDDFLGLARAVARLLSPSSAEGATEGREFAGVLATNLQVPQRALIGREPDLIRAKAALATSPIITIGGPGGVGKTCFAQQLAFESLAQFPDGVWFVDVSGVLHGTDVAATVATTIGARERADADIDQSVASFLAGKRALLIIDNCEHVLDAVASLLRTCRREAPETRFVTTSRRWLSVQGEKRVALNPLAAPAEDATRNDILASDAVRLFYERANDIGEPIPNDTESLESVASVCRRVDGIPLALEMAAGRLPALGLTELARRMADLFPTLKSRRRDIAERQKTIESLVAWSYELLSAAERRMLCRLSIFADAWTARTAAIVCSDEPLDPLQADDAIESLLDASFALPVAAGAERRRFRLYEVVRAFAERHEAQLPAAERAAIRAHHARYFAELARATAKAFGTVDEFAAFQAVWEHVGDVRAALEYSRTVDATSDVVVDLALGFARAGLQRGSYREGRMALDAIPAERGEADCLRGEYDVMLGNLSDARSWYERALDGATGTLRGRALYGLAWVDHLLGNIERAAGEIHAALAAYGDADAIWRLQARLVLANIELANGDRAAARAALDEALQEARHTGNRQAIAVCAGNAAVLAFYDDDLAAARHAIDEAITTTQETGLRTSQAYFLCCRGEIGLRDGKGDVYSDCMSSLRIIAPSGYLDVAGRCAESLAVLEARRAQPGRALELLAWARRHRQACGNVLDSDEGALVEWKIAQVTTDGSQVCSESMLKTIDDLIRFAGDAR